MTDSSLPSGAAAPPRRGPTAWLAARLAAERERWPLWLPVGVGTGVALYFQLSTEPPAWAGAVVAALAAAMAMVQRRTQRVPMTALAVLTVAVGFSLAQLHTARIEAPMLDRRLGPVGLEGTVVAHERLPAGARVVLADLEIERLGPDERPRRVRIRLRRADADAAPVGARIDVLAMLLPPRGPVEPGAFDFRRRAFFRQIGAVGFALGEVRPVRPADPSGLVLRLESVRQTIAERVRQVLDGEQAAIAVALLAGERGEIRDETYEAMQDSGLGHLLAISGLHVGAVAATIFFLTRLLLSRIEPLALHRPIKKWAAVAALIGAFAYMLAVGAPVPTQRAFLMTGLVLLAVLVDRTPVSMRLVAWAAVVVLALAPHSLLGPSFQMSFAAVVALVAAYETVRVPVARWQTKGGLRWAALYVGGVALTTLVASLATTPFAVFHFQRLATYGTAANLVAVPLTAFWIMPWGLASYALMPLGLEELALRPMGWGIGALLSVARTASAWPGAALLVPAVPGWALGATAAGGLWLCLWRRPWRLIGLAGPLLGLAALATAARPDVLVLDDGNVLAVRGNDGGLLMSSDRVEDFARSVWLRRDGRREADGVWPEVGVSADRSLSCDPLGCLYRHDGHLLALVRDPRALREDCAVADAVVATVAVPRFCRAPLVIDRFDLWREGAHALYLTPPRITIDTVADRVGDRPWAVVR